MTGPIDPNSLFCQMIVGGASFSTTLPLYECVVPNGINGPVVVFVTKDNQPIANDVVNRNPNSLVAGPTILYIDTSSQMLSQIIVNGGNQPTSGSGLFASTADPGASAVSSAVSGATPMLTGGFSLPSNMPNFK
jgi:hypothetical protein